MLRLICLASALALLALLAGCGGAGASDAPEFTASGKVTFNGIPIPNATVSFVAEKGPVAMGTTDGEGHFTLKSGRNEGAAVGKHKVAVYSVEDGGGSLPPGLPDPEADPDGYAMAVEEMVTANSPVPPKRLIPEKYSRPDSSGLTYEIKSGEANEFEIQLSN